MTIKIEMTHTLSYEDFFQHYVKAGDSLRSNLCRFNFTRAVFAVLCRSSDQSGYLKTCYNTANSEDQKLAAILVNNAGIFNDTGFPAED